MRGALEVTTPDRVVFGTDWPYAALPDEGGDPAPELDALGAAVRGRSTARTRRRSSRASSTLLHAARAERG